MKKIAFALLVMFVVGVCGTASANSLSNMGLLDKLTIVWNDSQPVEPPKEEPAPPKEPPAPQEEHHKKKPQPKPQENHPEQPRPDEQPPERP